MIKTLTIQQSESLLRYLRDAAYFPGIQRTRLRNYAMALCMLDAGLRVGELVQLRMTDLWTNDEPVKCLEVRPEISKGNRPRYIPLTIRLWDAIQALKDGVWTMWDGELAYFAFFAYSPQRQIGVRQVRRIIKRASLASIGIAVHPHVLRHTFATRLMLKTSIRVVQELLGHKSLSSTQVYTHPNNQDCIEAIKKLEE